MADQIMNLTSFYMMYIWQQVVQSLIIMIRKENKVFFLQSDEQWYGTQAKPDPRY